VTHLHCAAINFGVEEFKLLVWIEGPSCYRSVSTAALQRKTIALSRFVFEPSAHRATGQPWMIGLESLPHFWGPHWSAFPLHHLQPSLNASSMPNPTAAAHTAAATLLLLALSAALFLLAPVARAQDALQGAAASDIEQLGVPDFGPPAAPAAAPAAADAGASRIGLAPGLGAPAGELGSSCATMRCRWHWLASGTNP
jgi:hypothetical protein